MKILIYFLISIFFSVSACFAEVDCSESAQKISSLNDKSYSSEEKKKLILEAISLCPSSNSPKYSLAIWYFDSLKHEKSLKLLRKIDKSLKKTTYALAIARNLQAMSKFDDSIDWYNEALRRDSKDASLISIRALQGLGAIYLQREDTFNAKKVLNTALKLCKAENSTNLDTQAEIHYNLGLVHELSENFEIARKEFIKASELKKDFWQSDIALSKSSSSSPEALSYALKAFKVKPDNVDVLLAMASAYEKNQEYEKALDLLKNTSLTNKSLAISYATLLVKNKEEKEAIIRLKELSKRYPSDIEVLPILGWALLKAEHYTEAEIVLGNALALDNEHTITLENMGHLFKKTDRLEQANEIFNKISNNKREKQ